MKRELKFCRETDTETGMFLWFADLPEWKGEKEELQMVAGADNFLEWQADGKDEVSFVVSDTEFEESEVLKLMILGSKIYQEGGAVYQLYSYKNEIIGLHMWLCDVMKFVFGGFPEKIYIKKVE